MYTEITYNDQFCFFSALRRLRATNQIEEDIEEMRAEERAQQSEATISMMELVCSPTLRQPLIISVVMQLSQQLSGINAVSFAYNKMFTEYLHYLLVFMNLISQVFYYSTNLFITAGLAENVAKFVTIGIGVIMVNMTLVTMPLMDKTGRRTLHLYGLGGMFIFSIFITISLLITVSLLQTTLNKTKFKFKLIALTVFTIMLTSKFLTAIDRFWGS